MALSVATLSANFQAAFSGVNTIEDAAKLKAICDALAQAIVDEFKNNAEVKVNGVQTGPGTASGTIS